MGYRINKLYKNKFIRNVAVVVSGTAGAQAISMAFSPIVTRLYGPQTFGLMGMFMAIVDVVTPIAALAYPIAIVLPKGDREAQGIAYLSAYLSLGIACIVTLALLIAGDWLVRMFKIQEISSFLLLIPLAMLFAVFLQIMVQWIIRKKQFGITARVTVFQAFIINIAKTGLGLFNPVAAGLIILSVLGSAIQACMLFIGVKNVEESIPNGRPRYSCAELWALAKKYYDFPLYQTPQVFLNAISQSLPVLMLAFFFGPTSAGFYVLCKKLLSVPLQLIGKSVGDVFYPKIAEAAHNQENLSRLLVKATLILAGAGFFPFSFVIAFGPWVFQLVFGVEWIIAGEYARWLALWMFFVFLNSPSVKTVIVLKKQHLAIIINIVSLILRVLAIFLGSWWLNSHLAAVALYSVVGVFHNVIFILVAFTSSKQTKKVFIP